MESRRGGRIAATLFPRQIVGAWPRRLRQSEPKAVDGRARRAARAVRLQPQQPPRAAAELPAATLRASADGRRRTTLSAAADPAPALCSSCAPCRGLESARSSARERRRRRPAARDELQETLARGDGLQQVVEPLAAAAAAALCSVDAQRETQLAARRQHAPELPRRRQRRTEQRRLGVAEREDARVTAARGSRSTVGARLAPPAARSRRRRSAHSHGQVQYWLAATRPPTTAATPPSRARRRRRRPSS